LARRICTLWQPRPLKAGWRSRDPFVHQIGTDFGIFICGFLSVTLITVRSTIYCFAPICNPQRESFSAPTTQSASIAQPTARPEAKLINDFIEKIGELRPQLITFNGHSFDLPVLRYRAMVNRISAAGLQVRQYFHRYTDDAVDLCDVLGSYVPGGKVKLDEVSKILGLPGKPDGVDGSHVEEMVQAGQIDEVARYCESDVLNTYRVWLVYELFRGAITTKELDWSEGQARDFVASRKSTNPHLCKSVGAG
jgi:predicted 3'-5' exonuclease similar to PolB exonuclease domain